MSEDNQQRVQVQLSIERIYLKDASFESPGSPAVFGEEFRPEMQVEINSRVNSLGDNRHEVVLSSTVTAKRGENLVAYIVELQQAGIFQITGVEGEALRHVLSIHCPTTLFPYLREGMDNLIVRGGFPPVQLAPVNFEALYAEARRQHEEQAAAETGEAPTH